LLLHWRVFRNRVFPFAVKASLDVRVFCAAVCGVDLGVACVGVVLVCEKLAAPSTC
jgi:hypothetical protein